MPGGGGLRKSPKYKASVLFAGSRLCSGQQQPAPGSYGGGGGGGGGGVATLVSPLRGLCISIGHNYLQIGLVYGTGSVTMPHGSITCTK